MSLEAALAENTAAMKELTEQLKVSNANRTAALETLTAGATTGAKATGTKAKPKAEPEAEDFKGETGAEKVRAAFAGYMDVTDDAQKKARKEQLKLILAKLKVEKSVEIAEKDRAQAVAWVAAFTAGKDVPELSPPAEEPDEDEI